ncbi:MAG: TspO/MBR family protein [Synechococcales bacterium]|nr:TspO/MBR family protein [Synechococcales bacterium]
MIKPWMVIGGVTLLIALGANLIRPKDVKWFRQLQRPSWLTFERLIPVIWTVVFVTGAWSAYIVWTNQTANGNQPWGLMAFYIILELVTVAYTPVMFWTRSLKVGTIIGGSGFVLALILAILVFPISPWASVLLLPYLLWSPVGTYVTWRMRQLNPESA